MRISDWSSDVCSSDLFHHPYHHHVARLLERMASPFILSVHSFTPRLASDPGQKRPWDIGVLYNRDDRAARIDRKSDASGQSVSVRVDLGVSRINKKKQTEHRKKINKPSKNRES